MIFVSCLVEKPGRASRKTFTTGGGEGEQTIDHAGRIEFQVIEQSMRLMWPAGRTALCRISDRIGGAWKTVEMAHPSLKMMVIDLRLGVMGCSFFACGVSLNQAVLLNPRLRQCPKAEQQSLKRFCDHPRPSTSFV